ncbi:MAG: carbamoyltransferase HypF [Anaerolineae bacterium]|nr:carbamoyltransferase HypF [Anaerolineae bacterium]
MTHTNTAITALHVTLTGVVQGVGFRPFVYNLATRLNVNGWVLNHSGGVDIAVEGPEAVVAAFVAALRSEAPPLAHIESLDARPVLPAGYDRFEIRRSESQAGAYQLISPDIATCPDCVRELSDPRDRRYRYPFTNCTNCGPRFTIIRDIPYDRPNTTMDNFPLCERCRAEYEDPANRRFHAQPNACPVCGPQLWLVETQSIGDSQSAAAAGPASPATTAHALTRARDLLLEGKILAIKGLGGFHLACDATNAAAVALLRKRKRRPHKPFAVMVPALEDARALCEISDEEVKLLTSSQSPVVLLTRRTPMPNAEIAGVAAEVAPQQDTLGLMLPYTPLHHLLLRDVGRPLVMTSGNLSEEPIAKDNAEALPRLAPLADAFLLHNRDIYARYDDSVLQVLAPLSDTGEPAPKASSQFLRRARGYAPFPVRLPFTAMPVLATGPLLKNTFTLTRDAFAFVSQHIGDMENLETLEHYEAALATYQHLFRLEPQAVACDMHPDYLTTRFAEDYARRHRLPAPLSVQHHHAHIAACLADNGWPGEGGNVIGVAFDGTGYGEDGAIWGGEWFVGGYGGFRRVAHLEYLPLPGGDAAIHNPWRIAVAYLHTLLGADRFPAGLFCPGDAMLVRQQVSRRLNTPLTSSMGRLFDAVSALLGLSHEVTYEAQAAIQMETVAMRQYAATRRADIPAYGFEVEPSGDVLTVRVAALLEAILADVERGADRGEIALRFHTAVAAMLVQVCERIRTVTGLQTVALSGGVFQNRLLLLLALSRLRAAGFIVLLHHQVPCNDGGVSLGQAVLAQRL